MLLHVAGARHVLRRDPDEADAALAAAEDAGRHSLAELRTTVALLRSSGEDGTSAVPGLANLPRLVDEACATGLRVEMVTNGDLQRVDPMVGLTLYRVAQEALLNAARNAPDARTTISLNIDPDRAQLRVSSRPVVVAQGRYGYGLVGMRERAAAVGGELHAGPDDDGWLVACCVPTTDRPQQVAAP